jgi:hypothetical protein
MLWNMIRRPLRNMVKPAPDYAPEQSHSLRITLRRPLRNMVMDDVVWLSYADLAARLGIGHESARQKVKRARWARRKDNTGTVMIGVPVEVVQAHDIRKAAPECAPDDDPERDNNDPEHAPEHGVAILISHINRLERELDAVRAERDGAKAAEQALAGQIAGLQAVLDAEKKLHAGALDRVAEEKLRVEEWKAVADRFASQAERLAEARRGWWPWKRRA